MGTRSGRASALIMAAAMFVFGVLMFPASATFGEVTEWMLPPSSPHGIALGPDGNVWFVARGSNEVGRVTPNGEITTWPIPTGFSGAWGIAAGPDGAMWFTERSVHQIGRVDMNGNIDEFPLPSLGRPHGITWGPDGGMWFAETMANQIGRIDPTTHAIQEFGGMSPDAGPFGIATGPDGNLWFTERDGSRIGRITPSGQVTEYPLLPGLMPMGIALGPDGAMWFTEWMGNAIGRIDPSTGDVGQTPLPAAGAPVGIALGPDGGMWFTEQNGNHIGRIDVSTREIQEFPAMSGSQPFWITGGSDGNLWFTGSDAATSTIGRVDAHVPDTTAPTISIAAPFDGAAFLVGQAVTAKYSCADEPGGSGMLLCDGTVPSGAALDTSTAGVRTFEVVAEDQARNRSIVTLKYVVFSEWTSKLALPPEMSTASAGTPLHIVFGLGGDRGLDIFQQGYPLVREVGCGQPAAVSGSSQLAEDWPDLRFAGGRYRYTWRTDRAWAGTCRELVLAFSIDGGGWTSVFVRFE